MTKLKEQASSDKQLMESMKVQIKELERTHLLENHTKNLEIDFLKEQLATLEKNREKDFWEVFSYK